jgi:hypothetical protein
LAVGRIRETAETRGFLRGTSTVHAWEWTASRAKLRWKIESKASTNTDIRESGVGGISK